MPDELTIDLTADELIERVRVDPVFATKLWQAFGFARVPEVAGQIGGAFSEDDLASLAVFAGSDREMDPAVQLAAARSIGQATARLAQWQAEQIRALLADPQTTQTAGQLADAVGHLQQFVWRRHLEGYLARQDDSATEEGDAVIVGFADIVGYTSLSRRLHLAELESLLESFESAAHLIITTNGGTVIKSIGDAVMFTAPTPTAAAMIAVALHALTSDGELPTLRIGIASGRALNRMGDVFGEPVNIAARLAGSAREGTTLVDDNLAAALAEDPEFSLHHISALAVRGYRRLKAHALRRPREAPLAIETPPASADATADAERPTAKGTKRAAKARQRAERKSTKHPQ
ncbi:MAG: adenylate/guanylate cyclase domain-containing protein [Gordonia sp. (in: high G+C Gram-positive bacteria)]|uniref:adenylate/guanylate cyclase domain-containing protein n=1 Tax=Gordonia sp. (in: high G+C Gram-positive bacteria) TaxID=84139 RepID=UPI003BB4E343